VTNGRTVWWAKDCEFNARERVVELGEEFGSAGPLLLDELSAQAKKQRDAGRVKSGFRSLARACFLTGPEEARRIVEYAAGIGALDDYTLDEDGRRFTARVSGFVADQEHAHAAARQQAKRARDAAAWSVTDRDAGVTDRDGPLPTEQDITGKDRTEEPPNPSSSSELDAVRAARDLFAYWQDRCGHPHAKPTRDRLAKVQARLREGYTPEQIRQAIDGASVAPYVDDNGKRFDDLELVCRNGSKLESFIGRQPRQSSQAGVTAQDFLAIARGEA
jgi:hypothetical protein